MWAGFSVPIANSKLKLIDNGLCVVNENSIVFAISEERLSRLKHDHRLKNCFEAWKKFSGQNNDSFINLGVSSCSDAPWSKKIIPNDLSSLKVRCLPSHHHSHALSAFILSEFSESLILVIDAGGNTFSSNDKYKWWMVPREQTTLWMGQNGNIYLLERKHFNPRETGYGEWFRAFTYFLGWHSHTLSGNTMSLSAFGYPEAIHSENLWEITQFGNPGFIKNNPSNPIEMVKSFLKYIGKNNIKARKPNSPILYDHKNLSAYLQKSLIDSITYYFQETSKKYGVSNICLTGGVAQNCVLNAKVVKVFGINHVTASPFAGDVGQCVGNALYARQLDISKPAPIKLIDTFLGMEYSEEEIRSALIKENLEFEDLEDNKLAHLAAEYIEQGNVVAIFRSRSEFGPRALGNRSVLGDPQKIEVVNRIKEYVKYRENFMPLAPVINLSLANELKNKIPISPFMVFAPDIPKEYRLEFGYSLHIDNTARIQLVNEKSFLNLIIDSFFKRTNRRVLINTSFNKRGEPIVESPADAIKGFLKLKIDVLIIGNHWVVKSN